MFAGRSAAEVLFGDQDLRALVGRVVEHEILALFDVVRGVEIVTPVEEEELAVAGAFDALEELLRDDLVRVDVGQGQRDGGGGDGVC